MSRKAKGSKIREPSASMKRKMRRARDAIANQRQRVMRCPNCQHNAIVVFADTRGHVMTKCAHCGHIILFEVMSMRGYDITVHMKPGMR